MPDNKNPDPIDAYVGARITEFRKARGLTLAQLGEMVGVGLQQIHKYEKGENRISASMLHRVAGQLGRHPGEFFPSVE